MCSSGNLTNERIGTSLYSHQVNNRRFVPGGQGWISSRREVGETGGKKKKGGVSISITLILPAGVGKITHLPACPEPLIRSQYDSSSPHMLHLTPVNSVLCSSVHYGGRRLIGFVCDGGPLRRNACPFSCCQRQPFSPALKFNAEVIINLRHPAHRSASLFYRNLTCQRGPGKVLWHPRE